MTKTGDRLHCQGTSSIRVPSLSRNTAFVVKLYGQELPRIGMTINGVRLQQMVSWLDFFIAQFLTRNMSLVTVFIYAVCCVDLMRRVSRHQ